MLKRLILFFLLVPFAVQGQFKSASMQIDGLTCSLCSYGVERAIKKLKFVQLVKVDLNSNVAQVEFKPDGKVSIENLTRSVFDAGYSVRALTATFDFTKASLQSDYFSFGNDIFYVLNGDLKTLDGTREIRFVAKEFTDDSNYKQYKKTIEATLEPLAIKNYRYFVLR